MRLADVTPILDSMPDAVVVVGADGTIRFMNTQAESLFGYARGQLIGQPVEVLVPPKERSRHPRFRDGYFAAWWMVSSPTFQGTY